MHFANIFMASYNCLAIITYLSSSIESLKVTDGLRVSDGDAWNGVDVVFFVVRRYN